MDLSSPLLTRQQVADYLGIDPNTVSRLVKSGALTARLVGDRFRFVPADVEAYLDARKVDADDDTEPDDIEARNRRSSDRPGHDSERAA